MSYYGGRESGVQGQDARGRWVPFEQTSAGIAARQEQARRERESREPQTAESQRLASMTPAEIALEKGQKVTKELEELLRKAKGARREVEEVMFREDDRERRLGRFDDQTTADAMEKYPALDGAPRHLADRLAQKAPANEPIVFTTGTEA